ncbi:hypothetical protein Zm00014a_030582 [Zea mays]|uniref:Uncharacterized protein n=1 Tax=Zea mays TaxID=4577 RepID=A0A3L6DGW4_MAIZE|nr:hypothetical protein Zm00014a_030582 [Zea mays]
MTTRAKACFRVPAIFTTVALSSLAISTLSAQRAIICMGYSSRNICTGVPTVGVYLHYSSVCPFVLLMLRLWGDVRVY